MCGIIAYLGKDNAVNRVTEGLKTLEYRGYDSAGLAYISKETIHTVKQVGPVDALVQKVNDLKLPKSNIALGHTRWATHGGITEQNSHPHVSDDGNIAVVHNGIIENYIQLKSDLESKGVTFKSATDTEVIPNLISQFKSENILKSVTEACKYLKGSYAFLAMSCDHPDTIVAAKNGSQPLVIGTVKDAVYISSDTPTLTSKCDKIYALEDAEFAVICPTSVKFHKFGKSIVKKPLAIMASVKPATKGIYNTFMEREIHEIPDVIEAIEREYCKRDLTKLVAKIHACDTIHIAACGTSYHAGLYIARMFERQGLRRVLVHVASELPHTNPIINPRDIAIVISQSGETADTLSAMKTFKNRGLYTIAICNVEGSSIWRYADTALPTVAGTEVAVASTKAYIAQTLVGEIVVNAIMEQPTNFVSYRKAAHEILGHSEEILKVVSENKDMNRIFFLGKGLSAITALESALKVKEITYRHCEGIAAGELKHGTLALVDSNTLSIILTPTDEAAAQKLNNSIHEVKSRGSHIWTVPPVESSLQIIYAQLFALHLAQKLSLDPDKPRNLAKSVTVE
ncbi:MAG: glutamine--fructose-6-phosphate transaminase (isomerizing) [Christensenellaceae bacterium]|jgi:glucosamine--fructose-6-phosphate aminotransferase (isomerizing)|nr:glutamine--fructose-6-phosphate transaminase (isomerizing) [Christensenellaceae bacterium]